MFTLSLFVALATSSIGQLDPNHHVLPFIESNGVMLVIEYGDGEWYNRTPWIRLPNGTEFPVADRMAPALIADGWRPVTYDRPWMNKYTGEVFVFCESPGPVAGHLTFPVIIEEARRDCIVIVDITSQNAPIGDPTYLVPDGLVTGADLNTYVNMWLQACPD